jgi:hypothetical protein
MQRLYTIHHGCRIPEPDSLGSSTREEGGTIARDDESADGTAVRCQSSIAETERVGIGRERAGGMGRCERLGKEAPI